MLEKNVFFLNQIERCNSLAEQASNKDEQEFWLQLACRWQAMLQVNGARRPMPKPPDLSGELPSRLASSDDHRLAP